MPRFSNVYQGFCYICFGFLSGTKDANINGIQIKDDWKDYTEDEPLILSCKSSELEEKYQCGRTSDCLTRLSYV